MNGFVFVVLCTVIGLIVGGMVGLLINLASH